MHQKSDVETGLYYCKSRYYSPELCRWLSVDDAKYLNHQSINGLNLYAYCNNDSINKYDPDGHDAIYVSVYGEGGLAIVGHARLYYQDENGNWRCTEFTGTKKENAKVYDYRINMTTEELLKMLESSECDYKYLKGNFSDIKDFSSKYLGANYGGYNFLANNCLHYVRDALNSTGIISDNDTIVPALYNPSIYTPTTNFSKTTSTYGFGGGGAAAVMYCYEKFDPLSLLLGRYRL